MLLDTIELPDDLLWINEFEWNPVEQTTERSLTGALLVQEQAKLKGRPIILSGGEDAGWVDRATVVNLLSLSEIPNKVMTLTLPDLREYSVIFDRKTIPIIAKPLFLRVNPPDNDFYYLEIRLLSVAS